MAAPFLLVGFALVTDISLVKAYPCKSVKSASSVVYSAINEENYFER